MTTHKKPFPWSAVGVIITVIVLSSGIIANFAVNGEKVKQIEAKQKSVDIELSINSSEHKKIIETLGIIDKTVGRIETKIEICLPVPTRYARHRDSVR